MPTSRETDRHGGTKVTHSFASLAAQSRNFDIGSGGGPNRQTGLPQTVQRKPNPSSCFLFCYVQASEYCALSLLPSVAVYGCLVGRVGRTPTHMHFARCDTSIKYNYLLRVPMFPHQLICAVCVNLHCLTELFLHFVLITSSPTLTGQRLG